MGEISKEKSGHLSIFTLLNEALSGAFEVLFSGASILHLLKDTDSM